MKPNSNELFGSDHPDEHTLILFLNNHLTEPEFVEDHVVICSKCLDTIADIATLVGALTEGQARLATSKVLSVANL
jgi:anti-sigma factor ChrR (cupin superfamily)